MKYRTKQEGSMLRIIAARDIPEIGVRKGDKGGLIVTTDNLSQEGIAWVSGNARVYGGARVYDNARVLNTPLVIQGNLRHAITITETHIFIGCEGHPIDYWRKNIKKIGEKHGYSAQEIKKTIALIKVGLM